MDEIEVKLALTGPPADARRRIESAGAACTEERVFEENCLYDDAALSLSRSGGTFRLRRWTPARSGAGSRPERELSGPQRGLLTFKGKAPAGESRYKIRPETETVVDDADALDTILEQLGYRIAWRYQKYRTTFHAGALEVCLDETPIGLFVELEGEAEDIDAFAAALGFTTADYLTQSYRGLQEQRLAGTGKEPGDLVFHEE